MGPFFTEPTVPGEHAELTLHHLQGVLSKTWRNNEAPTEAGPDCGWNWGEKIAQRKSR